jgi:hypothetical protein
MHRLQNIPSCSSTQLHHVTFKSPKEKIGPI